MYNTTSLDGVLELKLNFPSDRIIGRNWGYVEDIEVIIMHN